MDSTNSAKPNDKYKKLHSLLKSSDIQDEISTAEIFNDIAFKIHQLRLSKNITQKELADLLGVQQSNISRWEKPGYQGYKVGMLNKIARRLGGALYISFTKPNTLSLSVNLAEQTQHTLATAHVDGSRTVETWTSRSVASFTLTATGEPHEAY